MESLDRPYGDDETDYVTIDPELTSEAADDEDVPGADPAEQPLAESGEGVAEGFEETEAQLISMLGTGQALWRVGSRSFVVQHYRSRQEAGLTNTDTGMRISDARVTRG